LLNLDSSNNLRVLYDKVESHTRELKSLGVPDEAYNCLLPSLIVKKLLRELALTISRRVSEDDWNLTNTMKELDEELKARERTYEKVEPTRFSRVGDDRKSRETSHRRSKEHPTATVLLSQGSHCCYCEESQKCVAR
jgi:hypothetical protein